MRAVLYERLPHRPDDGSKVYALGRVEFWPDRASLSMRVERLEPAGEGALLAQIEATKARLAADGLLSMARKRALPLVPRRIGLVTSAVGAARDDVLNNLWGRFPADVVLADTPVQGPSGPTGIVSAIARLNAVVGVDVIIVARGGGPLEDLMAFNDEGVCRAVAASKVPIVSAVGHEKDVTICDLVADVRVSTPTAAAAAVVLDRRALVQRLDDSARELIRGLSRRRDVSGTGLDARRQALVAGLTTAGVRATGRVEASSDRLLPLLARTLGAAAAAVPERATSLARAADRLAIARTSRVDATAALLDALSPERTVARGYAILRAPFEDRPITSVAGLAAGDRVRAQLRDGEASMMVDGVRRERT